VVEDVLDKPESATGFELMNLAGMVTLGGRVLVAEAERRQPSS
jgi:hypothetical protein